MTLDKIYQAAFTLKDVARETDLIRAPHLNPDSEIYLKTENLQVTGSFKVRGAYNKISRLSEEEKKRGVIACSAGNHAQGVALAAAKSGIRALICIPDGAPISKVEATRSYGAEVRLVPGVYDDAYREACRLCKDTGMVFIHPFDDEDVIAGQGTIGLEILRQLPDAEAVFVPVGGGGLVSGVAYAVKALRPECKVYGVQAAGAPGMARSLKDKKIETLDSVSTFADGIAVKCPGKRTYDLCSKYVDGVVTVTDDEIATAILALIEQHKMIAEGAGAASVAAAMFNKADIRGKKTVCLVSGGNIDVTILSRVISRGLIKEGRQGRLTIELTDRPGELKEVSAIIADLGGNVVSVRHDRSGEESDITACTLSIGVETRNRTHLNRIRSAIEEKGYRILNA
ncbi:MAG: threonine ammonia-lyase [Oscillospiraceae bacterium]|jgi:threonine dehydratase|nr:threonine ammonia-lyase [Oscillospiraceae bacterium]